MGGGVVCAGVQMEAKEQPVMSSEGILFRQGFSLACCLLG